MPPLLKVCTAAVLMAAALTACKKSSPTAPANVTTITIVRRNGAQSFSPNPALAGGKAVVFKNDDSITHRVLLNDNSIDTGDIAPGATSRQFTMPTDGTNYHCSIHPDMVGGVAAASGAAPPPCVGPYCGDPPAAP